MSCRRSCHPIILDISPAVCRRDYVRLCNGLVPIPLRCPDCGAYHTLGPHELESRTCHLFDRDSILVQTVHCLACEATRRILPPFVLPRCLYGVSAILRWISGERGSDFDPDESSIIRWRRKYFRAIRSGAPSGERMWARMIRADGNAYLVRAFRPPGGDEACPDAANPTSGSSLASTKSTAPPLGTLPRPGSGWPSRE